MAASEFDQIGAIEESNNNHSISMADRRSEMFAKINKNFAKVKEKSEIMKASSKPGRTIGSKVFACTSIEVS
jgi:hypothetical protein